MKIGEGVFFERIRRITGYLVGTTDRWNNAKRSEEKDRVKHGTKEEDQYRQANHRMGRTNAETLSRSKRDLHCKTMPFLWFVL